MLRTKFRVPFLGAGADGFTDDGDFDAGVVFEFDEEGGVLEGGAGGFWEKGEGLGAEGFAGGGIADVECEGALV